MAYDVRRDMWLFHVDGKTYKRRNDAAAREVFSDKAKNWVEVMGMKAWPKTLVMLHCEEL